MFKSLSEKLKTAIWSLLYDFKKYDVAFSNRKSLIDEILKSGDNIEKLKKLENLFLKIKNQDLENLKNDILNFENDLNKALEEIEKIKQQGEYKEHKASTGTILCESMTFEI